MSMRPRMLLTIAAGVVIVAACREQDAARDVAPAGRVEVTQIANVESVGAPLLEADGTTQQLDTAIFAGGCFWCMEPPFDKLDGVRSTTSGYTGGSLPNPTYEQVSAGGTGHAEAVRVIFEPSKVGYSKLLDVFWHNVDPLTANRQFCDGGSQYRSAIFAQDAPQKRAADSSLSALANSGRFKSKIVTEILGSTPFYAAEEYHQDYYEKNPIRYKFYRSRCGRDNRLEEVWGKKAN